MKRIDILIGVAGSGKSTWVSEIKDTDRMLVLSSDDIRKELLGTLDAKVQTVSNHTVVFATLNKRLEDAIKGDDYDRIIVDSTNINRRRRRSQYRNIKLWGKNTETVVYSHVFLEPISVLKETNRARTKEKQVPEEVIHTMYTHLEVPRITVDCDRLTVHSRTSLGLTEKDKYKALEDGLGTLPIHAPIEEMLKTLSPSKWKSEWEMVLDMPHDTPYHKESVSEHINMCIIRSMEDEGLLGQIVGRVAQFHDLGKGYTKTWNEEKQKASYHSHANLGAMYFLKYYSEFIYLTHETWDIPAENSAGMLVLETIFQHMNAHNGIGEKNIKNNNLDSVLHIISLFQDIDSASRISDL